MCKHETILNHFLHTGTTRSFEQWQHKNAFIGKSKFSTRTPNPGWATSHLTTFARLSVSTGRDVGSIGLWLTLQAPLDVVDLRHMAAVWPWPIVACGLKRHPPLASRLQVEVNIHSYTFYSSISLCLNSRNWRQQPQLQHVCLLIHHQYTPLQSTLNLFGNYLQSL